jgi:hypothetical protein
VPKIPRSSLGIRALQTSFSACRFGTRRAEAKAFVDVLVGRGGIMTRHHSRSVLVPASAGEVFAYVDDHARLSSHMSQSSWMMGGGRMTVDLDEAKGQAVGSHIRLTGSVLGMRVFLDEVVTRREPPHYKVWETVGRPQLLVIGRYRMGVEVTPQDEGARVRVFIDYDRPEGWITRVLGYFFGGLYSKWCVDQMLDGVSGHFAVRLAAA